MIDLPQRFENDIQGKDTYLVPLVVINNSIYLSTSKVTLDGNNYDPLLKNLGNIKESIGLYDKKFKISSINMQFFNYNYNNKTLSDRMFENEIINTSIDVYFKTQSAKTIFDCLKVYSGYIKNIDENIDTVTLLVEDRTEQTLHKDIPYRRTSDENVPDDYKNIPIPIVYGVVDKAPLVYNDLYSEFGVDEYSLLADDFFIKSISTPQIFNNDIYGILKQEADLFNDQKSDTVYDGVDTTSQYYIEEGSNQIMIPKIQEIDLESDTDTPETPSGSMIGFNIAEIYIEQIVRFNSSKNRQYGQYRYNQALCEETGGTDCFYEEEGFCDILAFHDKDGTVPKDNFAGNTYLMVKDFSDVEFDKWLIGDGSSLPPEDPQDGYYDSWNFNQPWGSNVINLEVDKFFDTNILKTKLQPKSEEDDEIIFKNRVRLDYNNNALITNLPRSNYNLWDAEYITLPRFYFQWTNASKTFWWVNDDTSSVYTENPYNEPIEYNGSQTSSEILTEDIGRNNFSLGMKWYNSSQNAWVWHNRQGAAIHWWNISNLRATKTFVVKDFINLALYAEVEGRVDNEEYRYTSTPQVLRGASAVVPRMNLNLPSTGRQPLNRQSKIQKQVSTITGKKKVIDKKGAVIKSKPSKGGY